MTATLHHGDCLEVMAGMEAGSVDAVVTDPPYGLAFMGKEWDHGLPGVDFWAEALRLLPPSGYLLAFGGTRTWHRLACAIEDAGFEIRDTLMWLYGSGFPKGTACLKPAWEPIILARKPGPKRELGIEECRVASDRQDTRHGGGDLDPSSYSLDPDAKGYALPSGRWPANLILDEEAGAMLDGQTGTLTTHPGKMLGGATAIFGNAIRQSGTVLSTGDSGGASRFFYCAKASRSERNAGLHQVGRHDTAGAYGEFAGDGRGRQVEHRPARNHHPTVKPLALMRWLVKLVAYPGDVVLDPFMGSGTTGVACDCEGRDFIGIEVEAEYLEIARRRIEAASAQERLLV